MLAIALDLSAILNWVNASANICEKLLNVSVRFDFFIDFCDRSVWANHKSIASDPHIFFTHELLQAIALVGGGNGSGFIDQQWKR